MKIEGVDDHRQSAKFHIHIRAAGERLDVAAPAGEYFVALVGPDPERTAKMVEYDLHVRTFASHVRQGLDLRVINPCFEGQIVLRQSFKAAAEVRIIHQSRRRYIGLAADDRRIMCCDLTDAAKPPAC